MIYILAAGIPLPAGLLIPGVCTLTAAFGFAALAGGGATTLRLTIISPRRITKPKARFSSLSPWLALPFLLTWFFWILHNLQELNSYIYRKLTFDQQRFYYLEW